MTMCSQAWTWDEHVGKVAEDARSTDDPEAAGGWGHEASAKLLGCWLVELAGNSW